MNNLSSLADELANQVNRLLDDLCTPTLREAASRGQWPAELWSQFEAMELTKALAPEGNGGHGLGWPAVSGVLQAVGRFSTPVPLAETMVASWLLGKANFAIPDGPLALIPELFELTPSGQLHGGSSGVAWPGQCRAAVVVAQSKNSQRLCIVRMPKGCGSSWEADVEWAGFAPDESSSPLPAVHDELVAALAVCHAAQIAGALDRILALSITYAGDRIQFGKPIAKFQAVQHMIARLAMETAAATAAAEFGLGLIERDPLLAAAVAKTRTSHAAGVGAALAHQVHGAIGITEEHELHIHTRFLKNLRRAAGSEFSWSQRLGAEISRDTPGDLWTALIDRIETGRSC